MTTNPSTKDRFWLLTGSSPTGPFSSEQIHEKLQTKQVTWQTPCCRFGESVWQPLVETPGIGPVQATIVSDESTAFSERPTSSSPPAKLSRSASQTSKMPLSHHSNAPSPQIHWAAIVAGLFVVALVGWIGYSWLRPFTPREVCERFGSASTAQEAKKYCTSNLNAAVEAMFRQQTPNDPKDTYEILQDAPASPDVGGNLVGFRAQVFVPAERRKIQFDGVFHVVKTDSWKVEDMYVLSVDRQALAVPISMAADYVWIIDQPVAGGQFPRANPPQGGMPKVNPVVAAHLAKGATKSVWNSGVGKWIGGLALAIGAILSGFWEGITGKKKNSG